MKVLITGADGLLGSNLVRELLARNVEVRVLLLPDTPARTLAGLDIDVQYGNVLDEAGLAEPLRGVDAVIHAAALTDVFPSRSQRVRQVNVEGTANMIRQALRQGVERFILIGSGSSFGYGTPDRPGDENSPFNGHRYRLDYIDSKYEAQQLLLQAVERDGLPGLVVAPTFMIGPYDSKPGSGAMVLAVHQRQMPFYTHGGRNFVYVKDVAVAVANALTKGKTGECYLAGHENLTYREFFQVVASVTGSKAPPMGIPGPLVKMYGRWGGLSAKMLGRKPKISYPMAQIACDRQCFSAQKAVQELNMPQTSIATAVEDAFSWFKTNGYC